MKKIISFISILFFFSASKAISKGMKRIVISEDYTIDGKKCYKVSISGEKFPVKDGHSMDQATCFQYYNPVIKEYIASRI